MFFLCDRIVDPFGFRFLSLNCHAGGPINGPVRIVLRLSEGPAVRHRSTERPATLPGRCSGSLGMDLVTMLR
jgi:hypothetical protein